MKHKLIQQIEDAQKLQVASSRTQAVEKAIASKKGTKLKDTLIPDFQIGDTVDIHQRILEGDKERLQVFSGVVIARKGSGLQETFTVRKIVQGEGVERIFPVCSPRIAMIEVKRSGKVRRAKLYYLRDRVGKATRLKERKPKKTQAAAPAANAPAAPTA